MYLVRASSFGKRIAVIYRNLLEFVSEKNSWVAALKILA